MKRNTIFVKALCSLLVICGLFLSGCKQNNKDHNMATKDDFMREAIALSIENVKNGGGPFGAVIVKDGKIIEKGNFFYGFLFYGQKEGGNGGQNGKRMVP